MCRLSRSHAYIYISGQQVGETHHVEPTNAKITHFPVGDLIV